jgi:putative membrane protein
MRLSPLLGRATLPGLLSLALLSCSSDPPTSTNSVDAATAQNERAISQADVTDKQQADAEFLVKATSNALLEVELGKLAQAQATTLPVRSYGPGLVQHRLEILKALRTLAAAKQLAIPNALGEDEQAAYHEVSSQTGTKLDKQLMALLVKTQKQDEDAFDDMQDDAYDGDIRGLAAKYLPPVREKLALAEEVADEIEDLQ